MSVLRRAVRAMEPVGATRVSAHGKSRFATLVAALSSVLMTACTNVPLTQPNPVATPATSPVTAAAPARIADSDLPALPPAGSGRGAYYMDDGPGDAPPERLMETLDAEPRVEPYTKRGNQPYVVFGKKYTPFTDDRPFKERGRASWYGKKFHGQTTSSGELYDMYKMTAAHPTLPLPSYVRVTNLSNGRQVIVRVNDRGPFLAGRVIDLSYTAALKLGYLAQGSAQVEVERLLPEEILRMSTRRSEGSPPKASSEAGDPSTVLAMPITQDEMPQRIELAPGTVIAAPPASPAQVVGATPNPTATPGIYLQLGAFGQAQNAELARQRFVQHALKLPPLQVLEQGALYRLYSGPFSSRAEAESVARQLAQTAALTPLIVQR